MVTAPTQNWRGRAKNNINSLDLHCAVIEDDVPKRQLRVAANRYAKAEKRQRHSKLTMKMEY